ncbi:MAG: RIP metalloprotease RseP [Bacteriovoracia bacterium]
MPQIISHLLGTLEYVFAIVTLLGGVIAVHEFGHFIFAKWAGIRVDTFSIGFGPKLFSKKWHETEYCLSLVPLGGFVKIYGQDPEELVNDPTPTPDRAFVKKSLPRKLSVLFGGPLFNYFLAILIFAFLAVVGVQKLPSIATRVIAETPAYQAGLRSGDLILSIDNQSTRTFDDVLDVIAKNPEKTLRFSILREGVPAELNIKVQKEHALTPYGEESIAGNLEGLDPLAREPVVAVSAPQHPWGFKSGDRMLEVEGVPVKSWEEFEKNIVRLLAAPPEKMHFKVQRGTETLALESSSLRPILQKLTRKQDANDFLDAAGLFSPELFIQEVVRDAPAYDAGIKEGDRLVSVNGHRVYSFEHLRNLIQNTGEEVAKAAKDAGKEPVFSQAVRIAVDRGGKQQELISSIRSTKGKDPLGQTIVTYTIGILSAGKPMMPPNLLIERTLNPVKALWIGVSETTENTVMTVVGLKKLLTGEVSAKTMGGPIAIGKIAGDTFSTRGWRDFLRVMAIISISLGVFNLIPVPILDGGHIVFAIMESIRGRPLSNGVQQAFLKVGLSLILLLMVFALYNDLSRVLPFSF